ncbi:MAG: hypothetical protein LH609_04160 [Rudanella sp.]|nr:hypothetical protein [Rudanella sp.]
MNLYTTLLVVSLTITAAYSQTPLPADSGSIFALEKAGDEIRKLQKQINTLKAQLRQEAVQNRQLRIQISELNRLVNYKTDSIGGLQAQVGDQLVRIEQLRQMNQQTEKVLSETRISLDSARQQIARLRYDQHHLTDSRVIRIYQFPTTETRAILLRNLAKDDAGFQYDDDTTSNVLTVTRRFDDQAEAWWVFDKTLDTVLEITLRLEKHQFDPQRTIVYADTKLMQKTRYTNKPFEEQREPEKIVLYRNRALRLLEGSLSSTSDK